MKKHILVALILLSSCFTAIAQPAGWLYSMPFSVTNSSNQLILNYSLGITVNTQALIAQNQMLPNGADIRFGAPCTDTRSFNYYIDSGINTATTLIYVRIDSLKPNSTRTIWMFYGNDTVTIAGSNYNALAGPYTIFNNQAIQPSCCDYTYSYSSLAPTYDDQEGAYFQPNQQILVVGLGTYSPSTISNRLMQLSSYDTSALGTVIANKTISSGNSYQWTFVNLDTPKVLNTSNQYAVNVVSKGTNFDYYFYCCGVVPTVTASQVNLIGIASGYTSDATVTTTAPYVYGASDMEGYADIKFYALPVPNSYVSYLSDTAINGSVFIDPVNTLVCPGQTASFSAQAGGLAPTYQWQVNTGTGWSNLSTNSVYSGVNLPVLRVSGVTTAMNGYQYRAYMTSTCGTGYGNPATLNVNTAPIQTPVATISGPNPACQYTNATYTINTNIQGGTYAWYLNGQYTGSTGSQYSFAPTAGSQVYAVVTVPNNAAVACYNLPVAVTNAISPAIGSNFTPIDSITPSANNECAGTMIDLTPTTNVVGGTYQWYVNGQAVAGATASTFTYAPNNGDQVTQTIYTPGNGCYNITSITSQPVVLTTIYGTTPSIQMVGPSTAYENQQVTISADISNYGSNYSIEWRNSGVPFDTTINNNTILFTKSPKPTIDYISARITPVSPSNGTCYSPETSANTLKIDFTPFNVGVNNVTNNSGITAYPNPFGASLHVNGSKVGDHVMLYDMLGRKVGTEYVVNSTTEEYVFEGLASGHYILHVTDSDGNSKANIPVNKL